MVKGHKERATYYGPIEGKCNICGEQCVFTEDHVPPKGSIEVTKRDLHLLTSYMAPKRIRPRHMQDGIKFRTLCSTCNNERLGKDYDPYLIEFSRNILTVLNAKRKERLVIPNKMVVKGKPQRIARAVVGHLLAAYIRPNMAVKPDSAPFPDILRSYFLDPLSPLPAEVDIRYWVYTGDAQVIIRHFGLTLLGGHGTVVGDLLKYYPLAFWVVFKCPTGVKLQQQPLVLKKDISLNKKCRLPVDFSHAPRSNWPEEPDDGEVVLLQSSMAYVAINKKPIATKNR